MSINWKAGWARLEQSALIVGIVSAIATAGVTYWLSADERSNTLLALGRLEAGQQALTNQVSGIDVRLVRVDEHIGRIEGTIRELHPNEQGIINNRLVLNAPADGLIAVGNPVLLAGGMYGRAVALIGQNETLFWQRISSGSDDSTITQLVSLAIQNPAVDAVRLADLRDQVSVPSHLDLDPSQSFVVRGSIKPCLDKFSAELGKPTHTQPAEEGVPRRTGRDYVQLLEKLNSHMKVSRAPGSN